MNMLRAVFRELIGVFVDDGSLALEIVAVVALAAISATLIPDVPLAAGTILLFGCLGVLLANVACCRALMPRPPHRRAGQDLLTIDRRKTRRSASARAHE
jgi:hypothetical protein